MLRIFSTLCFFLAFAALTGIVGEHTTSGGRAVAITATMVLTAVGRALWVLADGQRQGRPTYMARRRTPAQ